MIESVVHMASSESDCFVVIGYQGDLNAVIYTVMAIFEDYSLIFCVMMLFWQRGKNAKKSVWDI